MNSRESSHSPAGNFSERSASHGALQPSTHVRPQTHARHLLRAPAQDPHILQHAGLSYYCESSNHGIFVRAAHSFLDLGRAEARRVWAPPARGPVSRNIWAPELHEINGQFYIYFAADDGVNARHRMWVLKALTTDPTGPYELVGSLATGGWAIDGTILTDPFGNHIFVWSGWPGGRNGRQNLYMSRMKSPTELIGPRILLCQPTETWEKLGMAICEGPQILQRAGRTFIVYSASGSWTQNYCLGILSHEGGDLLDPSTWKKSGAVFAKNDHACGVGHCCFVTAENGQEDWLVYHAKTSRKNGWSDREVRAQRFTWSENGTPDFGAPLAVALHAEIDTSVTHVAEVAAPVAATLVPEVERLPA